MKVGQISNTALGEKAQPEHYALHKSRVPGAHTALPIITLHFSTLKIYLSDHMHLGHFYLREIP